MSQLNMHLTPEFKDNLACFMRIRRLRSKSEAIRVAVKEGLEAATKGKGHTHFRGWIGMALGEGENPNPRFRSNEELWESTNGS